MRPKCENEICNRNAAFTIAGILCCGNHVQWAARKGLEHAKPGGVLIDWAPEEAA